MPILTSRRLFSLAGACGLAVLLTVAGARAFEPVYIDDGLAIEGYDPVAYFTDSSAIEGSAEFEAQYGGATWRFKSAGNRDVFVADPAKYAPQYGGYCAYAVSEGYTASIDPDAWTIVDGKLYLNYSTGVKRRWEANRSERIMAADRNWPLIVKGGGKL